jgi:DNA-binding CsgD family transcriptional regulator
MSPLGQPEFLDRVPQARRARVEYVLGTGGLAGTVTFPGRAPLPFRGTSELERCLGLGAGGLMLVEADHARDGEHEDLAALTSTERGIAERALAGESNREIADALYYSVKSVEAYLTRIYRRLGVEGREGLATLLGAEDLEPLTSDSELVTGGAPGGRGGSHSRPHAAVVELLIA